MSILLGVVSRSVPDHIDEHCEPDAQPSTRAHPLRQSYPFTDDVSKTRAAEDDIAERTRRQLASMGIELNDLHPQEKSR